MPSLLICLVCALFPLFVLHFPLVFTGALLPLLILPSSLGFTRTLLSNLFLVLLPLLALRLRLASTFRGVPYYPLGITDALLEFFVLLLPFRCFVCALFPLFVLPSPLGITRTLLPSRFLLLPLSFTCPLSLSLFLPSPLLTSRLRLTSTFPKRFVASRVETFS